MSNNWGGEILCGKKMKHYIKITIVVAVSILIILILFYWYAYKQYNMDFTLPYPETVRRQQEEMDRVRDEMNKARFENENISNNNYDTH